MKASRMAYRRNDDAILSAVLAEINKSAVNPDPGFMKREAWFKKWKLSQAQGRIYLTKAVKMGILEIRRFRVITNGRLRALDHYGPPDCVRHRRRS
jgi:hypothetical protein